MASIIVSGKRKRSVARVTILDGKGNVMINNRPHNVLPNIHRLMIEEPIRIAKDRLGKIDFDIYVKVKGGGRESQIEASRLAIARGLVKATKSNDLKKAFLAYDRNLLIADTRRKEPYKPGDSKARAKMQKSYR